MQQICDGYNPNVRMGNWLEESYSVPQPYRTKPVKYLRETEIDIGYLDAQLKLRPLNRMARLPPWNTSGLVQAPQFKNYQTPTTTKQNYDLGIEKQYFKKWKPFLHDKGANNTLGDNSVRVNLYRQEFKMLDNHNVAQLCNWRPSDTSSFKSQIVPAKHIDQKSLLQTTYQHDISEKNLNSKMKPSQKTEQKQQSQFRRIRSEITLKSVPPIFTYK